MQVDPALLRQVDDAIRTTMTSARDGWETRVELSTAAVVLGCAAEVPEVLHELWSKLIPERYVKTVKGMATFGLLFVIAGVAGELAFSHFASRCDGQLQTFNTTLLTEAQQQIATTEKQAAEAQRDTQQLKLDADAQRAIAAQASFKAAQANERAAKLEVEAADLQARLILQAPRSNLFTTKNLTNLKSVAKSFRGQKAEVRFEWPASAHYDLSVGGEVPDLANSICAILQYCEWQIPLPLPGGLRSKGVFVIINPRASPETIHAAESLNDALAKLPLVTSPKPITSEEKALRRPEVLGSDQKPIYYPPFDEDTIIINVSAHP